MKVNEKSQREGKAIFKKNKKEYEDFYKNSTNEEYKEKTGFDKNTPGVNLKSFESYIGYRSAMSRKKKEDEKREKEREKQIEKDSISSRLNRQLKFENLLKNLTE
jgi:hypothetical protein